ncbi:MAG: hypothetical protein DRJ18_00310 [Candidatus Methanomethylicota archaeon]|nr:MAG: hypothetical protein DRJ18_00310 [Candidatus Verstraetearchaeota archaeon]
MILLPFLVFSTTQYLIQTPNPVDVGYDGSTQNLMSFYNGSGTVIYSTGSIYEGDEVNFSFYSVEFYKMLLLEHLNSTLYLRNKYGDSVSPVVEVRVYFYRYNPVNGSTLIGVSSPLRMGYQTGTSLVVHRFYIANTTLVRPDERIKLVINIKAVSGGGSQDEVVYLYFNSSDYPSDFRYSTKLLPLNLTVYTDKTNYTYGETMHIFGDVTCYEEKPSITVNISVNSSYTFVNMSNGYYELFYPMTFGSSGIVLVNVTTVTNDYLNATNHTYVYYTYVPVTGGGGVKKSKYVLGPDYTRILTAKRAVKYSCVAGGVSFISYLGYLLFRYLKYGFIRYR